MEERVAGKRLAELFILGWRRQAPTPAGSLTGRLSFLICRMESGCFVKQGHRCQCPAGWKCSGLVVSASTSPQPYSETLKLREVTMQLGPLMRSSELGGWCEFLYHGSSQIELGFPESEDGRLGTQAPPSPTSGGAGASTSGF